MASVEITSEVFRWAQERAGLSHEKLAKRLNAKVEKIRAWEDGVAYPSVQQAQRLAAALRVPLGYLVLPKPPEITVPIADFRTLPGTEKNRMSIDLQAVLDDALRKRDWYREWRQQEGESPLEFVGRFLADPKASAVVEDMRKVLDIPPGFAATINTWERHLRELVQKAESAGILVLQSGIVGSNTHRPLSVEDFQGFAIADSYAPIVFINAQDFYAARIFTLAHELAHIWTGTSGISNPNLSLEQESTKNTELLCNHVAAEFLVPRDLFIKRWTSQEPAPIMAQDLAKYFRVSARVVLRRAYETGLISMDEYRHALVEVSKVTKNPTKRKGGDFYATLFTRNSRRFATEILFAVNSGRLPYHDGARLLNTAPGKLAKAFEKMK